MLLDLTRRRRSCHWTKRSPSRTRTCGCYQRNRISPPNGQAPSHAWRHRSRVGHVSPCNDQQRLGALQIHVSISIAEYAYDIHRFYVSTASTRSSTTSRPQSGTATPVSRDETLVSVEVAQTLASTHRPIYQTSTYKKATKGSVIVAAPELLRAKKEHREQGRVKPEVYKEYIAASSVWGFALLAIFVVVQQIVTIGLYLPAFIRSLVGLLRLLGANLVLKSWAQHNQEAGRNTETGKYLALYGLAILASSLLSFFAAIILWVWCVVRSARYLHDKVLAALLRSPLSFFDTTPSGRYAFYMHFITSFPYPPVVSSTSFQGTSTSSTKCSLVSSQDSSGPG